jgi:hypothetical protein
MGLIGASRIGEDGPDALEALDVARDRSNLGDFGFER